MTGKTILLVEDNSIVMRNNSKLLKERGATVLTAETLAEARVILDTIYPNVAVIDIMLPDGSGLDLLKEIRASSIIAALPVLLLTAKAETNDIVHGLSTGADDYLVKPYDLDVFAARIEALLRRAASHEKPVMQNPSIPNSITIGQLRFDMITNQAFYGGNDLLLSQKEFALLFLLAQNAGKMMSPQYLYETVWKQPLKENAVLKTHIYNLKKKLSRGVITDANPSGSAADSDLSGEILIESSWGEGYYLVIDS